MITLVNLTGDVADLIGDDFDARRTKVWIEANVPHIADLDNNVLRLGTATATVGTDGTFTFTDLVATGSADTNLDDSNDLQYRVWVDFLRPASSGNSQPSRRKESFGWYAVTATSDIVDLVEAQQLEPSFASQFMADAQALLDAQIAISGIDDTDSAVSTLIEDELVGPLTNAALAAASDARIGLVVRRDDTNHNTSVGTTALEAVTPSGVAGIMNAAFGKGAMAANLTGSYNTAVGFNALQQGTAPDHCTAVGYDALRMNTTGTRNTAMGTHALDLNTTGNENTALGDSAMNDNTTGLENTAVGCYALKNNTDGRENSGVGFFALYTNETGDYNCALGTGAVQGTTAASRNVGIGYYSLGGALTTDGNVAVGDRTLAALTSGGSSTAVGYNALRVATTGDANTAVGYEALVSVVGGNNNTAVGYRVLDAATSALKNTGIGYNALSQVSTGNNNTAIGGDAGNQPSATGQISWGTTTAQGQVLVGYRAGQGSATARDFITAVGALATVDVNDGTALGVSATVAAGHTASVALGGNTATTAARQVNIGNRHIELTENTAPGAPAANGARLYVVDDGAGKTQLAVRFATGAVQILATEP